MIAVVRAYARVSGYCTHATFLARGIQDHDALATHDEYPARARRPTHAYTASFVLVRRKCTAPGATYKSPRERPTRTVRPTVQMPRLFLSSARRDHATNGPTDRSPAGPAVHRARREETASDRSPNQAERRSSDTTGSRARQPLHPSRPHTYRRETYRPLHSHLCLSAYVWTVHARAWSRYHEEHVSVC
jgi:hypothetical protein